MSIFVGPLPSTTYNISNPISASGGTETIATVGCMRYKVHTFTNVGVGTFTVTDIGSYGGKIEYLIIAGGGSGGNFNGGGGGAGGLLQGTTILTALDYTITVGAGGTATFYNDPLIPGRSGSNSSALGLTAIGGGSGGSRAGGGALSGGSGGGGSGYGGGPGASGTPGQGNNGSQGVVVPGSNGGGGGGAGAAGYGGAGGIGIYSTISGVGTYYAGGGGGSYGGTGGLGGGATGSSPGTPNTGGGGMGEGSGGNTSGGSGIVIIRYQLDL